ncbi:RNA dependent RNA polymerase-domain-containing protein [Trametes punicea]|nr:RNA dependent RNA polymerase-domain-containing protein [Trametes punicea]
MPKTTSMETLVESANVAASSGGSSHTVGPTPPDTVVQRATGTTSSLANARIPDPPCWRRTRPNGSGTSSTVAASQIPRKMGSLQSTQTTRSSSASVSSIPALSPVTEPEPRVPSVAHVLAPSPHIPALAPVAPAAPRQPAPGPSVPVSAPQLPSLPAFNLPTDWKAPEPVVVGHFPQQHKRIVERWPWGAQWELARFISTGFDPTILQCRDLSRPTLFGNNASAVPEVKNLVQQKLARPSSDTDKLSKRFAAAFERELAVKLPWEELDHEEQILHDYPLGGIGCNADQPFLAKDPDWYGGRVHFIAQVHSEKGSSFRIQLDRPVLGTSNRFARRFGSRRFVRVRLHKDVAWNANSSELRDYFRRPFIIGGAVFRSFFAKEQNVFLFRTDEGYTQSADGAFSIITPPSNRDANGARGEYSLMELISWHNDMELNSEQTMVKWAARFALGLSNSVPGVRIEVANVRFEPDIICDAFEGSGKPPSEMQMTDGCGFANRALMRALKAKFPSWQEEPTAVQFRLAGGKGLLLVRPDLDAEEEEHPTIWLRPSQLKIKYASAPPEERLLPPDADPAWFTLDVLRASRMNTPIRLSAETIINLAENGVPYACFQDIFKVDLEERIGPLLAFKIPEKPKEMQLLWHAIAREGHVMMGRVIREALGVGRAAGYVAEDRDDELEDEDEDGLNGLDKALKESQSSAWWEDPVSGLPSRLDETCLTLLDSGFTPSTCPVLKAKLKEVIKQFITGFRSNYRFAVPMSCSAFIVPDPHGVLGPNEIHVKCSRRDFTDADGRKTDIILGDVLVTRHPCKVPSDVQKVKAVFHEKLRHYCDVIVVSTKSHVYQGRPLNRHLASLTGGGDYDGDTMQVFWDPNIVSSFIEPDPEYFANEPPEVQRCLIKDTTAVSAFLASIPPSASQEAKIFAVQHYLLGALHAGSHVSLYSSWWEKSTYVQGYSHPETIFLAYMFCAVLDGLKTGVSVDPQAFATHRKKWGAGMLLWKSDDSMDGLIIKRPQSPSLPPFIMDILRRHVKIACDKQLGHMEKKLGLPYQDTGSCSLCKEDRVGCALCDQDLVQPWLHARLQARELLSHGQPGMWGELLQIKDHVEKMHREANLKKAGGKTGLGVATTPAGRSRNKARFTELPIEKRQDILREQSKLFHAAPHTLLYFGDPTLIKASYAYFYDHQVKGWSRFPWNVATRALCEIKAKALGTSKTISGDFYQGMAVSPVYLRHHTCADSLIDGVDLCCTLHWKERGYLLV